MFYAPAHAVQRAASRVCPLPSIWVGCAGKPLSEHRMLFLGAGEAGTGIAQLIAEYLHLRHGMPRDQVRRPTATRV
jgi:hypothetical protein